MYIFLPHRSFIISGVRKISRSVSGASLVLRLGLGKNENFTHP